MLAFQLLVLILASYNCLSFVLTYLILFQRSQTAIARSRSEPVDTQVKTIKMDTFFRIIPSTPGVKEATEWLKASR
jgi:hypothetical protein